MPKILAEKVLCNWEKNSGRYEKPPLEYFAGLSNNIKQVGQLAPVKIDLNGGIYANCYGTVSTSMSGNIFTLASGANVTLASYSSGVVTGAGNPLLLNSNSGGSILTSAAVKTVTLKALLSNSGDIYVGGHVAGNMPYSGVGFVLSAGEMIPLDVPNVGYVRVMGAISGYSKVSWVGTL